MTQEEYLLKRRQLLIESNSVYGLDNNLEEISSMRLKAREKLQELDEEWRNGNAKR